MNIHKLKIQPEYLDDLLFNHKTFEVRNNDRGYQINDVLVFQDKRTNLVHYFKVKYIHSGLGMQEGYVCMSVVYMESAKGIESWLNF